MAPTTQKDDIGSKLSNLNLNKTKASKESKPKEEVADSWEDEADVSSSDNDSPGPTTPKTTTLSAKDTPAPPPPPALSTSSTPFLGGPPDNWGSYQEGPSSSRPGRDDSRRPEKTDAVARRLIVAGLGLKAPKLTDEQRAYQKSVREQERKRRDDERVEKEQQTRASETAKAAMWDD